mgnify:CR=1 FL=1
MPSLTGMAPGGTGVCAIINLLYKRKEMSPLYIATLILTTLLAMGIIILILLHSPKGEGLGGIGGTASMFSGKRGAEAGLDRLTWGLSIAFLICCLLLGFGFIH